MKNSLVIYRRRSCLLTCPELIAREVAKTEAAQKKKNLTAERKKASEIKKRKREDETAADRSSRIITLGGWMMH